MLKIISYLSYDALLLEVFCGNTFIGMEFDMFDGN